MRLCKFVSNKCNIFNTTIAHSKQDYYKKIP